MRSSPFLVPVLASALLLVSCGGGASGPRVSSPFTAQDAAVFDNAVDVVSEPDILEGRWYDDWASDLVGRVTSGDIVMVVNLEAVRHVTTPDGKDSFRLQVSIDRMLLGDRPAEPAFAAREDEAGYDSIAQNERRILDRPFVAFVKWKQESNGDVVARWHLSPASTGVLATVNQAVQHRQRLSNAAQ
mgnify:CR=1 FL=1